ncbi:hypothetical protein OG974_03380 [Streptomyces sp. NBC_00597]|uniref:hypothetical protein n=1 Tax=unclassified Streptomyces TaxID=2593676 RepID=UPI002E10DA2D|nr:MULTISPECIES: hypothetical protein [unclassified Streptomyces]WSR22054.1 hypothetical protein OG573_24885 [Streptomyces sp. NBC_01205]
MPAAARPDLASTWARVEALAERTGRDPAEVLSPERLSRLCGVEPTLVPRVVAGTAPGVPLCLRVHRRFLRLRATRRDKHGREWSLAAIAEDFRAPGASLGPLNAGTGLPRLGHAAGVQRFFGVYAGFLLADSQCAVERALAATGSGSGAAPDLGHLSYLTGMPPYDIRLTLDGAPPRLPLKEQVHQRFEHLRRTRPRADGQPHSLAAIAHSFHASGQSLTRLARGEGLPNLAAAAGIQRFYGVDGGFLLADDTEALATALAGIGHELETAGRNAENPMLAVLRAHDVRSIVTRAGRLSPAGWKSLADHLDDLLAREGVLVRPGAGLERAHPMAVPDDLKAAEGGAP